MIEPILPIWTLALMRAGLVSQEAIMWRLGLCSLI